MTHMDMNSIDTAIGERVHRLMWLQQVNQIHLAAVLDLDPAAVSRRLRGRTAWKVSELLAAAKLLEVDVMDLMPAPEVIAAATATQPSLEQVNYVTKRYDLSRLVEHSTRRDGFGIRHMGVVHPLNRHILRSGNSRTRLCHKLAS